MDDVLLISTDPNEQQDMLNITNEITNRYHIAYGKEKKKNPKNRTLKEDANHQTRWNDPRI